MKKHFLCLELQQMILFEFLRASYSNIVTVRKYFLANMTVTSQHFLFALTMMVMKGTQLSGDPGLCSEANADYLPQVPPPNCFKLKHKEAPVNFTIAKKECKGKLVKVESMVSFCAVKLLFPGKTWRYVVFAFKCK